MSKGALLRSFVASKKDVQIKFKDDPGPPVGPGKVELVHIDADADAGILNAESFFKMTAPAVIAGPGNKPAQVLLPIIFAEDDVLWLTEGPLNADGQQMVHELPGNRSRGGLHIP